MTTRPKALAIVAIVVAVVAVVTVVAAVPAAVALLLAVEYFAVHVLLVDGFAAVVVGQQICQASSRQATAAAAAAQAQLKLKTKNKLRHVPRRCITNIASRISLLPIFPYYSSNLSFNSNSNCWLCLSSWRQQTWFTKTSTSCTQETMPKVEVLMLFPNKKNHKLFG